MKKQLNEIKRMQQLAGILKENTDELDFDKLDFVNEPFSPEDNISVKWKDQPANPKSILTDTENGEEFTKEEFWKDIMGIGPENMIPDYGNENPDGTWTFDFDSDEGGPISGFVEGEDFEFEENELEDDNYDADSLFEYFKSKGNRFMDKMREWDAEELMNSYPGLSEEEAEELEAKIQNFYYNN